MSKFVPNPDYLEMLTAMGYSKEDSTRALKRTSNKSADLAATWLLDFQGADMDSDEEECAEPGMEGFLDDGDFFKMVLVVNTSLNMGTGKVAAQVAHTTLALYKICVGDQRRFGEMMLAWEQFGESKIVLQGSDVSQLTAMATKAESLGLAHYLVQDAGRTQIPAGSITVLGIMGKNDQVDRVTGSLELL